MARMHALGLSLQFALDSDAALHRGALPRHQVARWIRHALDEDAQITVRLVDTDEGRALNRDYRQKDYATNVLTFGYGDDTHGHVDDIARFVAPGVVVLAHEEDPADENHARSLDNLRRLEGATDATGAPIRTVTLPYPRPVVMDGTRLPASYANFYLANGVVIVPTFNDPNDRIALNTLAELLPDRQVVGIHAVDLVWGLGTLHCLTQQQPAPKGKRGKGHA